MKDTAADWEQGTLGRAILPNVSARTLSPPLVQLTCSLCPLAIFEEGEDHVVVVVTVGAPGGRLAVGSRCAREEGERGEGYGHTVCQGRCEEVEGMGQ
jgi:hypothetical protein